MSIDAYITLFVIALIFVALIKDIAPSDLLFVAAGVSLAGLQIITAEEAFSGFAHMGMITVAALFVIVAGLRETGILAYLGRSILGKVDTTHGVLRRLSVIVLPLSAFLNNTPVVAMFAPILLDWCRRFHISPSKLLIPLSYISILGGTCTLIGTSSNLVIHGLMIEQGLPPFGLFEISWIGVPYAIVGILYLMLFSSSLLPERKEFFEQLGEARKEYIVEMFVEQQCSLVGQTVEDSHLRGLRGLFLIEIQREGETISPVNPDHHIQADDRLIFTGIVSSIVELKKIPGLIPATDENYEVRPEKQQKRRLWEVVISNSSPLIGETLAHADFRATYGAAVVAIHRAGSRLNEKLGQIQLRAGDTLLLQAPTHFRRAFRNDPAFYLISDVSEWRPLRTDRAWIAAAIFLFFVFSALFSVFSIVISASVAALLMVLTGCLTPYDARRSLDWQVLITIAAAFGVGIAVQKSGLAALIANGVVSMTEPFGPIAALVFIYLIGSILTEIITNNAAAILLFPLCLQIADIYQVSPIPFLIALLLSASASFMTPIGYQTNMMVYGPGGYRFTDFIRIGVPLNCILLLVATAIIPNIWPF